MDYWQYYDIGKNLTIECVGMVDDNTCCIEFYEVVEGDESIFPEVLYDIKNNEISCRMSVAEKNKWTRKVVDKDFLTNDQKEKCKEIFNDFLSKMREKIDFKGFVISNVFKGNKRVVSHVIKDNTFDCYREAINMICNDWKNKNENIEDIILTTYPNTREDVIFHAKYIGTDKEDLIKVFQESYYFTSFN